MVAAETVTVYTLLLIASTLGLLVGVALILLTRKQGSIPGPLGILAGYAMLPGFCLMMLAGAVHRPPKLWVFPGMSVVVFSVLLWTATRTAQRQRKQPHLTVDLTPELDDDVSMRLHDLVKSHQAD